jgi:hypothetical protein
VQAPAGYLSSGYDNGQVFSGQLAGTIPLQLWYNQAVNDHLTVASAEGVAWAKANNYVLQVPAMGYIYANDQQLLQKGQKRSAAPPFRSLNPQRQAYCRALLEAVGAH